VIEALKGHPLFAHVTLTRSERSPIAALVTELLEDLPAAAPAPWVRVAVSRRPVTECDRRLGMSWLHEAM
jgi:hypothetical protein